MARCPRCDSCESQWDMSPCRRCNYPHADSRTSEQIRDDDRDIAVKESEMYEFLEDGDDALIDELLSALENIFAITDRKHVAWDRARAVMRKARLRLNKETKDDK